MNIDAMVKLQNHLAKKTSIDYNDLLENLNLIAATDVAYKGSKAFGVMVIYDTKKMKVINSYQLSRQVFVEYKSGLLSFRELPVIYDLWRLVNEKIDLIITDGYGIAHPRKMGLATQLGIYADIPTIGIAKTKYIARTEKLGKNYGDFTKLLLNDEFVGYCYRSRSNTRPVYITPGHKIGVKQSLELIIPLFTGNERLPFPLAYADQMSKTMKRKENMKHSNME